MSTFIQFLATFTIISFISSQPSFSQKPCKSKTFPTTTTTTFTNCINLPTLNATLHYTYNSSHSNLSMAFAATPPSAQGWVSWAINPKALAMLGSQALIAYRPTNGGSAVSVNTYDIKAYSPIINGSISYNVSNLSAKESDGEITIFATWTLPKGEVEINQVWQVGPVVDGKVGKHSLEKPNLNSFMKLSLVDGPASDSPATAPAFVTGGDVGGRTAPATKSGVVKGYRISPIMVFVFLGLSFLVTL